MSDLIFFQELENGQWDFISAEEDLLIHALQCRLIQITVRPGK
jgi:hypothetical protein